MAPTVKSTSAGSFTAAASGATSCSAKQPLTMVTTTRSPGFSPLTPGPTALTTPAASPPGMNGGSGLNWYFPWERSTSGKFTPAAWTEIWTSPSPGRGDSTSTTRSPRGPTNSWTRTARMLAKLPRDGVVEGDRERGRRAPPQPALVQELEPGGADDDRPPPRDGLHAPHHAHQQLAVERGVEEEHGPVELDLRGVGTGERHFGEAQPGAARGGLAHEWLLDLHASRPGSRE